MMMMEGKHSMPPPPSSPISIFQFYSDPLEDQALAMAGATRTLGVRHLEDEDDETLFNNVDSMVVSVRSTSVNNNNNNNKSTSTLTTSSLSKNNNNCSSSSSSSFRDSSDTRFSNNYNYIHQFFLQITTHQKILISV